MKADIEEYTLGPLSEMPAGNKYILMCQDGMSKYLVAVSIKQQGVETVTRVLVEHDVLIITGKKDSHVELTPTVKFCGEVT
ncbi:hypothetical protein PR048_010465 [Dryococelus australis]|uniref:Uncharacterized protein n=1 Tax=Dryococelus australis TaxID=614101 RepID=A0ABQ9I2U6_9NEOP|nr:hypothetical protein PR048_010465 [Dryococelus australis]